MSFTELITENYVTIYELIGLVIILGISAHISERMKKQTLIVIGLMLAEMLIFYLEQWAQTFERLSALRVFTTAATYSIYPVILIMLMQITREDKIKTGRLLLLLIPEFICVPIFFTSQWTHIVFHFSEENSYLGGPLAMLPYGLFAFYAAVFIVSSALYFRQSARDRFVMLYIALGSLLGVVGYLVFDIYKDYSAFFTAAIVLYYILVYIHKARVDTLTALLNRQSYYQDMKSKARSITGVASVDMNDLKYLNDNMGHEAGDTALKTVAGIMHDNCGRGGTVYRVGGDEFMIFYTNASEDEISAAIAAMREKMAETPYVCAFGYAMKRPDETVFDAVRESDEKMYIDKAELKKAKAASAQTEAR